MDTTLAVSVATFMAGVIFYSGRITARVENLEHQHERMIHELDAIHGGIRQLERLIKDGNDEDAR